MVSDLSEEQRNLILQDAEIVSERYPARGFAGRTLREFIGENMLENSTLTELYEEMSVMRLKWPFRLLRVTVEARVSRGYDIAVLDDETIDAYAKGEIEQLSEFDPNFNLETAYQETIDTYMDGYVSYDYAVMDDQDRTLVEWDD